MNQLFIIEFIDSDIYFISFSKHITKMRNMLEKYNILTIKDYHKFTITENFRNHPIHQNIIFIHNPNFLDYFNYFYTKYEIKNNFYQFNRTVFNEIITYLNNFKPQIYIPTEIKQKELYECPKCFKSLTSIIYFNKHMESCQGLTCKLCNKPFSSVQTYNNHINNCGKFKCEFCKSIFNSKFKFNKHTIVCLKNIKKKNKKNTKIQKDKNEIKNEIKNENILPKQYINKLAHDIINDVINNLGQKN